jgi:hypothetical protein
MLSDTFSRQGLTPIKLKSIVVLHIGQPVKIVVAEPDRIIVAEHAIPYIVTQPPHVHISDIMVRPTRQDYP